MIVFNHLSLDISEAEYKGQKIELRKNVNLEWEIWVSGKKVKAGPFETQGKARDHLESTIDRMEGPKGPSTICAGCKERIALIPGIKECRKCGTTIKRQPLSASKFKACRVCGSTVYPHRCNKLIKPKPFSPKH